MFFLPCVEGICTVLWEAGNEYPVESIGFTPNLHPLQGGNGSNSLIPLEGAYFRFSEINCHAAGKHILVNVAGAAGRDSVSHQVSELSY